MSSSAKVTPAIGGGKPSVPVEKKKRPASNLKDLENGPNTTRGCTDLICLIIYILFVLLSIYITAIAFNKGNPWKLAQPFDIDGNACGSKGYVTENHPYAFFFNPIGEIREGVICVKSCPDWAEDANLVDVRNSGLGQCYLGAYAHLKTGFQSVGVSAGAQDCKGNNVEILDFLNTAAAAVTDPRKVFIYRTEPYLQRYCIPKSLLTEARKALEKITSSTDSGSKFDQYFSDLANTWGIILASAGFAFVVSLFYLIILRWCTGFFIWLTILLYLAAVLALAIVLHKKSYALEEEEKLKMTLTGTSQTTSKKLYWCAVVLYIILSISIIAICTFFKTIELCIAILKSSALFVKSHFFVILIPIIVGILIFGYAIFWMFTLVFLWTVGDIKKRESVFLAEVQWDGTTRNFVYAHLFALFWHTSFLLYYGQFAIIAAASLWYFNQGEGEVTHPSPVKTGSWWGFRYHLGSLAFASFILAVIMMIKVILAYIQKKVAETKAKNPAAKVVLMILCVLQCCVDCFERFIKFITKTGLIMMAISGTNFCTSCRDGITLLLRHPLKFGLIGALGEIFVFLGKIFIGVLTALGGYIVITTVDKYSKVLFSPVIPTAFFFLIGLTVGSIFMSVYGFAADAILCCFFVDKEMVEKKGFQISRAPAPLREFFEENKSDSGESDDDKKPAAKPDYPKS